MIRWLGQDALSGVPDKYSDLIIAMLDPHIGLASKAEPYAVAPQSGCVRAWVVAVASVCRAGARA